MAYHPTFRANHRIPLVLAALSVAAVGAMPVSAQDELPNACPVDGCEVRIADVKRSGDELALTFEANFKPDLSKNHIHVWWGDNYRVEQVSDNAETAHGVKQGDWHLTDEYPDYVTQGGASLTVRGDARTLCVSASDRDHNILDVTKLHCVDVSQHL